MVDHRDLVGQRAVETDPPHRLRSAHRIAKKLRRHVAVDVAGVDPMMPVRGLHHDDRWVFGDGRREAASKNAQEVHWTHLLFKPNGAAQVPFHAMRQP